MARGRFISLEGGEGSGKTTQVKLLAAAFAACGVKTLVTREPGGTPSAEAIRDLLVKGTADKWHPVAETLLFYAARVEHVERHIKPSLESGSYVISDRFHDSTMVYQGIAKSLGIEYVKMLHTLALGPFVPDLTLYLDINPQDGLARAGKRGGDETRFEQAGLSFHVKVREGFLALAESEPQRIQVLDAGGTVEQVHARIVERVNAHYGLGLTPC